MGAYRGGMSVGQVGQIVVVVPMGVQVSSWAQCAVDQVEFKVTFGTITQADWKIDSIRLACCLQDRRVTEEREQEFAHLVDLSVFCEEAL